MSENQLTRVEPEQVGVSSESVHAFIEALERSGTEMHGLMMLRSGKVFAEGWWAPYAPGLIHGSQSLTKTVTGAAYGAAELAGILDFGELVINVFPEYAHLTSGPYWDELRVYHLLTMSSGMVSMPAVTAAGWMEGFFKTRIQNRPGTAFFYNSIACSLVGACIQKRSGQGLLPFMKQRVFDKIGIDSGRLKWYCHADGLENGSGGIVSTTEDNARLIQLFLRHGRWDGEQVISSRWADMAAAIQNIHAASQAAGASSAGYGGMMWVRDGCFYADGAMGQLAVGFPEKDMVIALNQTVADKASEEHMRQALFGFSRYVCDTPLPRNAHALERLRHRLKRLALPAPPYSSIMGRLPYGRTCRFTSGSVPLFADDLKIFNAAYVEPVHAFEFFGDKGLLIVRVYSESGVNDLYVGLDGRRWNNHVKTNNPDSELSLAAHWKNESTICFEFRWLENCRVRTVEFTFDGKGADIMTTQQRVGGFDEGPWYARADWD